MNALCRGLGTGQHVVLLRVCTASGRQLCPEGPLAEPHPAPDAAHCPILTGMCHGESGSPCSLSLCNINPLPAQHMQLAYFSPTLLVHLFLPFLPSVRCLQGMCDTSHLQTTAWSSGMHCCTSSGVLVWPDRACCCIMCRTRIIEHGVACRRACRPGPTAMSCLGMTLWWTRL